jgi:flagella basal body P-ring formation protein FlgA
VASDPSLIVGQRLSHDVPSGGLFRTHSLESPPLVRAGERVTLLYRSGVLEATASAIALDGGPEGGRVRVRNESSKRIVQGTILGPGMIEVRP